MAPRCRRSHSLLARAPTTRRSTSRTRTVAFTLRRRPNESRRRAEVLADCDVFASPSAQESFGITTLEAWSQAKPVVVGDGPAQRSVVEHGVSGILVPHGHEARLLEALGTLGADASLRARLGDAGRRRLQERYDHSAVVSQYHSLFMEAGNRGESKCEQSPATPFKVVLRGP